MRRKIAAALLLLLTALPAAAQTSDPFRTAPAPAPQPAPKPAPRLAPQPETAPAPAPVPSPPDPAKRFDGLWLGQYSCQAIGNKPGFARPMTLQIKDSRVSSVEALPANQPGYAGITGMISPDGSIALAYEGVGLGVPGSPYARGEHFTRRLNGRFSGEQLLATDSGVDNSRGCALTLTRHQ